LADKKRNERRKKDMIKEIGNQIKEKVKALRFDTRLTGKITEIGENYIKSLIIKMGKLIK
jgi:hypothetical protein